MTEHTTADAATDIDVVLVTGLSGAGRGTAAKVLEDLGWYVADNLPPELIARMVDLGLAAGSRIRGQFLSTRLQILNTLCCEL